MKKHEHSKGDSGRAAAATTCFDVIQWHKQKYKHENANLQINRRKLGIIRELNIRNAQMADEAQRVSNYILSCRNDTAAAAAFLMLAAIIFIIWIYYCWLNECAKETSFMHNVYWGNNETEPDHSHGTTYKLFKLMAHTHTDLSAIFDCILISDFIQFIPASQKKTQPYPVSICVNCTLVYDCCAKRV